MRAFVTGGAGFIGSNLVRRLVCDGHTVTAYDDLSLGRREFLEPLIRQKKIRFVKADLTDDRRLAAHLSGHDTVFHLQANSDVARSLVQTDRDLRLGTIATYRVLETMRVSGVKRIVFASTSAVYGNAREKPTPESYGPLFPISLYGASKLAAEGLITAFAHCFGIQSWIFRFGNVAGRNGTHGIIVDLLRQFRRRPKAIRVLGDGHQAKPYIHVDDCIDGMLYGLARARKELNCFNLTTAGSTKVKTIVRLLMKAAGAEHLPLHFTGGKGGWRGDVPQVRLDGSKLARLGWHPQLASYEAVKRAVAELVEQTHLL